MVLKRLGVARAAPLTLPPQPPLPQSRAARRLGGVVLGAGLAALAASLAYRLSEKPRPPGAEDLPHHIYASRRLNGAAAILAFSVLTDSAVEHYRGAYNDPAMFLAPTVAAATLGNSIHMLMTPLRRGRGRAAMAGLALATGAAGLGFHVYNVSKREGGIRLLNLFYGAPIGAPAAIAVAGLAGLAASRLAHEAPGGGRPTLFGRPAGPLIGLATSGVMIGTVAEAALLHFRGAFHDPFMFVPVTLPPAAALILAAAISRPKLRRTARILLQLSAAAGIAGAGFHVYGVQRNMGGFYNWGQNLLNGPPIPAPPSFTGVALAGLGALRLMEA